MNRRFKSELPTNGQTDRQTDRRTQTTTVTLAAHARRGLIIAAIVSRASRIFPTCTHARMTRGESSLVIRACVHVGKIRLVRETIAAKLCMDVYSWKYSHKGYYISRIHILLLTHSGT